MFNTLRCPHIVHESVKTPPVLNTVAVIKGDTVTFEPEPEHIDPRLDYMSMSIGARIQNDTLAGTPTVQLQPTIEQVHEAFNIISTINSQVKSQEELEQLLNSPSAAPAESTESNNSDNVSITQ